MSRLFPHTLTTISTTVHTFILLSVILYQATPAFATTPDPARTVFVQLFEWKWSDIARECETYLGPQGFKAVQISPPEEHPALGGKSRPWWINYQPVSYQIESRMGSRADFKKMAERCAAAGVQIYADAVINHMAAGSGTGSAGSTFTDEGAHRYTYPGIYGPEDFHWNVPGEHSCMNADGQINYNNKHSVQDCELVGLPDLATEREKVRARIADYLIDLYGLGVRGFRIDAVKHIAPADVEAILAKVRARVGDNFYVVQEVIDLGGEAVKKEWYYPFGDVNDFMYGRKLSEQFKNQNGQKIANLKSFGESWGLARPDRAVVFTDNHDMQRGEATSYLTFKDNGNSFVYTLGNIFMLAWPYGYPQLMSSYDFSGFDDGPPSNADGSTKNVYNGASASQPGCFTQWKCEHRWREIGNMVPFRNAAASSPVTDWWDNGNNQIAFGRGDKGFLVINREDQPLQKTFQTHLPPGTYCDVIAGNFAKSGKGATCSGRTIIVDEKRQATISVPADYAAAIHVNAMTAAKPMVTATFTVKEASTVWGENVYLVGEDVALGKWDPKLGVQMTPVDYPAWQVTVKLPPSRKIQFKFVKINGNGEVLWESNANRTMKTPKKGAVTASATWGIQ
ncbi:alpha amylase C-terminal domain-containing protein [Geomonas sp. RF6]|uniref:carbohydrate-binding module family 20 domain-containing protein n=1 Tax=Geomonas sp. RF6 TaxID=2897342 RepID=UPI001E598063|nr:carbohydrate-binding module family 20 domain-containing protein [Geomonas sp. RF6]UFS70797.1 alpha amylase C-terminal domain-containing protein [Geomonas sp. RF6]